MAIEIAPLSKEEVALEADATRHMNLARLFEDISDLLPRRHHIMVNGPRLDGTWYAAVIDARRTPRKVVSHRGSLVQALTAVRTKLRDYTPPLTNTPRPERVLTPVQLSSPNLKRDAKGRYLPHPVETIAEPPLRVDTTKAVADKALGFTRNRDVVAYLIGKRQRVTQYELREVYGIKNPAQAVNEFEEQYHVKLKTGKKTKNGDIPYTLDAGKLPEIEGMLPMFVEGVEDPDDRLYVQTLSLYLCRECGRNPLFKPRKAEDKEGIYYGVCPLHGPEEFTLF